MALVLLASLAAPGCAPHAARVAPSERPAENEAQRGAEADKPTPKVEPEAGNVESSDTAPAPEVESVATAPPALRGESELVALEVPGHLPAIVWLPIGTTEPKPLIVATHGNYDTPESTCYVWGQIVEQRGFVLCPRGAPRRDSPSPSDLVYHYLSTAAMKKEISAALVALEASYGEFLDSSGIIYSGFSQGAIMGLSLLLEQADRFPRAVLIEGGYESWNAYTAKKYSAGGGSRILFACGQWGCQQKGGNVVKALGRSGLPALLVSAPKSGHTYGGEVALKIAGAFDWLVEGDPRWFSAEHGSRAPAASEPTPR